MATIYNSELTKEITDGAKIQTSHDLVPTQLAEKVVPVMEVNPKLLKYCNILKQVNSSSSGNTVIYTTPANKDFYLTCIVLSTQTDATSDGTSLNIWGAIRGKTGSNLAFIPKLASTAIHTNLVIPFPVPILLEKSENIILTQTFSVGAQNTSATVIGYTVD